MLHFLSMHRCRPSNEGGPGFEIEKPHVRTFGPAADFTRQFRRMFGKPADAFTCVQPSLPARKGLLFNLTVDGREAS